MHAEKEVKRNKGSKRHDSKLFFFHKINSKITFSTLKKIFISFNERTNFNNINKYKHYHYHT